MDLSWIELNEIVIVKFKIRFKLALKNKTINTTPY